MDMKLETSDITLMPWFLVPPEELHCIALVSIINVFKVILVEAMPPLSIVNGHQGQGLQHHSDASVP
jgi:hypothetical protein